MRWLGGSPGKGGSVSGWELAEMRERSAKVWGTVWKWLKGWRLEEEGVWQSLHRWQPCLPLGASRTLHSQPLIETLWRLLQVGGVHPPFTDEEVEAQRDEFACPGCPAGQGRAWIQTLAICGKRQA